MSIVKTSIPYAKALYSHSKESGNMDVIYNDIKLLSSSLKNSSELNEVFNNPTIKRGKWSGIIEGLFGKSMQKDTLSFLNILASKNRLNIAGSVTEAFIEMYNEAKGVTIVNITTAEEIPAETQNKIVEEQLKGQKYEINHTVDKSIVGGYILEFNNKILDNSVSQKIQKLKQQYN